LGTSRFVGVHVQIGEDVVTGDGQAAAPSQAGLLGVSPGVGGDVLETAPLELVAGSLRVSGVVDRGADAAAARIQLHVVDAGLLPEITTE
jgi:hypothetical protein